MSSEELLRQLAKYEDEYRRCKDDFLSDDVITDDEQEQLNVIEGMIDIIRQALSAGEPSPDDPTTITPTVSGPGSPDRTVTEDRERDPNEDLPVGDRMFDEDYKSGIQSWLDRDGKDDLESDIIRKGTEAWGWGLDQVEAIEDTYEVVLRQSEDAYEWARETTEDVFDWADETQEDAERAVEEAWDELVDVFDSTVDAASDVVDRVSAAASAVVEATTESAEDTVEWVSDTASNVADTVRDAAEATWDTANDAYDYADKSLEDAVEYFGSLW